MIAIDETLISDDIVEQCFVCDLNACKGMCCIEGDAGAPLTDQEIDFLEEHIELIKPYMTKEGIAEVDLNGVFDVFIDNSYVTPLIENKACVYAYYEGDVVKCAIEKAFEDGKIDFIKPISCHLYPVRIQEYESYDAVNYHEWEICKCARIKGAKENVKIFEFLKTPLIRKYGQEWYDALSIYYKEKISK